MSALDAAKALVTSVQSIGHLLKLRADLRDNELNQKIVTLERDAIALQRKVNALEVEADDLKRRLAAKESPPTRGPDGLFYFADAPKDPCCPRCWDGHMRRSRLMKCVGDEWSKGRLDWKCPVCDYPVPRG